MENRLMSLPEFQKFAGGIGRNSALRLAREAEARVKVGRRLLVDRRKFEAWIDENAE